MKKLLPAQPTLFLIRVHPRSSAVDRVCLILVLAITAVVLASPGIAQQPPAGKDQGSTATPAKRPPQAKTQQEYADYNTAYAIAGGAAMEKAANDFAAKYPASEMRSYLYSKAMHEYQSENNTAKMLATGNKVLALDPDNSIALVLTANVLADGLSDTDQDLEQKAAEIKRNAGHALETIDTAFVAPAQATAAQITDYKNTLQSMAHSALGIMELKIGDNAGAEKDLQTAADLNKSQPDPYVWYHLALAQDHQKKYTEALASVDQALHYTGSNPDLGRLAAGERERLVKLTGGSSAPKPQPPPSNTPK
jgi:tetratricopeptide (TPR) repeat protein